MQCKQHVHTFGIVLGSAFFVLLSGDVLIVEAGTGRHEMPPWTGRDCAYTPTTFFIRSMGPIACPHILTGALYDSCTC